MVAIVLEVCVAVEIQCGSAVDLFEKHLDKLPHGDDVLRMVMFSHDSPGVRGLRRRIAEALVLLLESHGYEVRRAL